MPLSDTRLFDEDKVKEAANFPLRLLISLFNQKSSVINKSNVKKIFFQVFQSYGPSNIAVANIVDYTVLRDFRIQIFSKPLDFKSLILSTSSVNLTISMKGFLVYLNCFDSVVYDTFLQVFNVFDYYVRIEE